MTQQEIYTKVRTHLLTQMARSIDGRGDCRYRGPRGLMCAVGPFIPDDEYDIKMETRTVTSSSVASVIKRAHNIDERGIEILARLQRIHDLYEPPMWCEYLNDVATERGFTHD